MFARPFSLGSLTALLVLCLCQHECSSFQLVTPCKTSLSAPLSARISSTRPHCNSLKAKAFGSTSRQAQRSIDIFTLQKSPSDDESAETEADAAGTEKAADAGPDAAAPVQTDKSLEGKKDSSVLWKTVVLAVPLFCKFVIVLVIKFLTDLVVFPLLLLYRLARLTKRRILNFFQSKGDGNVNGSSSSL
jgi:hypothetical protein